MVTVSPQDMENELRRVAADLAAVQAQQQHTHSELESVQGKLQKAIEQSASIMIQLVTANPKIKEIYEAGNMASQILTRLQDIEMRESMMAPSRRFRTKEAADHKPNIWTGEKSTEPFMSFATEVQVWIMALHDDMIKVVEMAETMEEKITERHLQDAGAKQMVIDDFKEMDRRLWQMLIMSTKGEAKNFVSNPDKSGFKAWRQLVSHYDPRTGADRSVAYSRVAHPVSQNGLISTRPRNLQSARKAMQIWEQAVADFEIKYSSTPKYGT